MNPDYIYAVCMLVGLAVLLYMLFAADNGRQLGWSGLVLGIVVLLLILAAPVNAADRRLASEDSYNKAWCEFIMRGKYEKTFGRQRVDCLTAAYAVEADFADKKRQGIGQALDYAEHLDRLPGLLLILERPKDCYHLDRARAIISRTTFHADLEGVNSPVHIRLWTVGEEVCEILMPGGEM